jgi:hypothetical protein
MKKIFYVITADVVISLLQYGNFHCFMYIEQRYWRISILEKNIIRWSAKYFVFTKSNIIAATTNFYFIYSILD